MVHRLFCLKPLTGVPLVLGFILTDPIPLESALWRHPKVIFHPPCIEWHWLGLRGDVWIFPTGQDLPLPALLFHPPPDPPPSSYLCTFFSIVQIDIRIFKYALYCCILAPDIKFCLNFCIKLYCAFYSCIVSLLRIIMFCSTTQMFHTWARHNCNGREILRKEHFPSLSSLSRSLFGVHSNCTSGWLKAK